MHYTRSWPAQANLALSCKAFRPLILAGQEEATLYGNEGHLPDQAHAFNACLAKHPNNLSALTVMGDEFRGANDPMPALPPLLYGWA